MKLNEFSNAETKIIYFNPYLIKQYDQNPFLSVDRHYPVDFGVLTEYNYLMSMEFPENWEIDEAPATMHLPCQMEAENVWTGFKIWKKSVANFCCHAVETVYNIDEYHKLREFISLLVQAQQAQFTF